MSGVKLFPHAEILNILQGLEGIAVNSKGQVLVADRENHRVQMFWF